MSMYKSKRSDRGGGVDRSSSPLTKRSRSTLGRYGDLDSEDEPERGRGRSPVGHRGRDRDYYDGGSGRPSGGGGGGGGYKDSHHSSSSSSRPYPYKVLCISALHGKASDEAVRETLYREFKRFGEISVKVVHEPDERVAYVYFRSYEDARDAKHSKSRILVFDKPVMIEAAYESSSSSSAPAAPYKPPVADSYGDRDRDRGYGGGGGGNYRRSPHPQLPPPQVYDRGHRDDRGGGGGYDRYHGPPSHQHHPPPPQQPFMRHQEYRRDPHDYGSGGGGGGGGRGHHQPMYAPRYDNYSNSNRYPPGPPPGPRGPPMQQGGGPGGDRGSYENKKDKFPNYLHHVNPEDDPLATRTLFAGNLEVNISDEEMRRIFGRYGTVEDIDIKRPPPGTGNAYAFVRYANLDMAARAKTELSGQYIGKFQCKIGYGKVNPTTKIWIGGLGPWASLSALEREFDRFGSIKKVEWIKGDHQAFITYETIDAAQAAVKDMRGYPLGGTDKRIRTDFAGVEQIVGYAGGGGGDELGRNSGGDSRNRGASAGSGRRPSSNVVLTGGNNEATTPTANSQHSSDIGSSPSDSESTNDKKKAGSRNGSASSLSSVKTVMDITKKQPAGWQGSLILKNSAFPAKLHITDGDYESVSALMKDEDGKSQLRITQRLRLDQTKLEDVTRRISSSTGFGVFLAWPVSIASPMSSPNAGASPVQSRPLKNLVSYLKQKEAAGVITLANRSVESTGVLYAFPPCAYSTKLLQKTCPSLEESSEDYLLVVVIKGGTA